MKKVSRIFSNCLIGALAIVVPLGAAVVPKANEVDGQIINGVQTVYVETMEEDTLPPYIEKQVVDQEVKPLINDAVEPLLNDAVDEAEKQRAAEEQRLLEQKALEEKMEKERLEAERKAEEERKAAELAEKQRQEEIARQEAIERQRQLELEEQRKAEEAAEAKRKAEEEAKKNAITWTDTNETVYATRGLNVRSGPGTEYAKLGSLDYAESVKKIAIGSNGWAKIEYNGETAYAAGNFLSKKDPSVVVKQPAPTQTKSSSTTKFDGSTPSADIQAKMNADSNLLGVMYVPAIGMSPVNVYASNNGQDLQGIADRKNAAYAVGIRALNEYDVKRLEIGDHNTHNFNKNTKITEGMVAYINCGDQVVRLRCISTIKQGSIAEYDTSIYGDHGVIATLCCAPGGTRTINRWVVTDDSDMSFMELYNIATRNYEGYRE